MTKRKIAVIGGGPAGFMAAVTAAEGCEAHVYERNVPLKTVLLTGNGRCNLSNNIPDFKELASNYPRGEKFLYSVFSRFGVKETLEWFNSRGLATYTQDDNRIFPKTDRAASVRELFLEIAADKGIKVIKKCQNIAPISDYDAVIIATGGKNCEIAENLSHTITKLRPSLTSLNTNERWIKGLAGVSVKNTKVQAFYNGKRLSSLMGDFVFTHSGLSGPVVFNTSAYCAFVEPPFLLKIDFGQEICVDDFDTDKSVSNVLKQYIPKSIAVALLFSKGIDPDKKSKTLNKEEKTLVQKILTETEIKITSFAKDGEIVTAGGVSLKEVNPATMESKLHKNVYFCGEVLDIDGLSGGFNLQMCWSTGYIAGLNAGKS